jgi:hypothetical protein
MNRLRWLLVALLLVALDVYFIVWRREEVQGNVEAQFIIVTPAFIVSHVLQKRRADRQHTETQARLDEQSELLAEAHRKVSELHEQGLPGGSREEGS